jgi:hypothetical protein
MQQVPGLRRRESKIKDTFNHPTPNGREQKTRAPEEQTNRTDYTGCAC